MCCVLCIVSSVMYDIRVMVVVCRVLLSLVVLFCCWLFVVRCWLCVVCCVTLGVCCLLVVVVCLLCVACLFSR